LIATHCLYARAINFTRWVDITYNHGTRPKVVVGHSLSAREVFFSCLSFCQDHPQNARVLCGTFADEFAIEGVSFVHLRSELKLFLGVDIDTMLIWRVT